MGVYDPKKQKFFNLPTVIGIIVLAIVSYVGWFYLPHLWKVWRMTGAMSGVCNDAYREFDNNKLLKKLVAESRRTGLVGLEEQDFTIERVPYPPEEIPDGDYARALFEKRGKYVIITMDYWVDAKWPLQEKYTELEFHREVKVDMAAIKW